MQMQAAASKMAERLADEEDIGTESCLPRHLCLNLSVLNRQGWVSSWIGVVVGFWVLSQRNNHLFEQKEANTLTTHEAIFSLNLRE